MKFWSRCLLLTTTLVAVSLQIPAAAQPAANEVLRERLSMDRDWRFDFGHATDRDSDFDAANSFPFN